LAVGAYLAQVWCSREQDSDWVVEGEKTITPFSFPRYLWWFLALIAIVGWVGVIYFSGIIQTRQLMSPKEPDLQLLLGAVAMTMTIAAVLLYRRDRQFIIILFWGCYVSLLVFMTSDNWIWELAENYPVKPVAEIVKSSTQAHQVVLTSYPGTRPSLDFYSDRRVISVSPEKMKEDWVNDPSPYFLLDHPTLENSNFPNAKVLKTTGGWNVVTKNR
ncbi:MAG: phospholipid carrier-dependent glycosyltransferase, partial [Microcoleaceae cyanobacterium]